MSVYAIGDIHGTLKALKAIFQEELITKEDTVVFLGDYVDKGKNTRKTINWLIKKSKKYNFIFLQGNHEVMMARAKLSLKEKNIWMKYGGKETLGSYGIKDQKNWIEEVGVKHWDFIESGKPYYELEHYVFVHAGLASGIQLADQDPEDLFWKKRETPGMYSETKKVICGHTARKNGKIADFGHTICIDTFAYGGKWLTCLNVETGDYLQAKSSGKVKYGKL